MDIVNQINGHIKNLDQGLANSSFEQRKSLMIAILGFYFQWDNFEEVINTHVHININKNQLISDINNNTVRDYKEAIEKNNTETDVYSDNYEEPDQIDLFILDAFATAVSDVNSVKNIVTLFIGIIDVLDYYENFSADPEFWNNLLENEVAFQNEILIKLKSNKTFDPSIYKKRYHEVQFAKL